MSIFSLSGISLIDAIDIFNFGAIYIMSMVYIANVLSQKKLLENSVSIYASIAFLIIGSSITLAVFKGIFAFDILHHWTLRLTMSVAMAFIIYSAITNYNEKRFAKVVNAVAVKNRNFSEEVLTLNTKVKQIANHNKLTNKNNLNIINKIQDEILSSVRGDLNNNISNYYEFSNKIYKLNGNMSLLNEEIKKHNNIKKLENSIKQLNLSILQILTTINHDIIDIQIFQIYNLVKEKIEIQYLKEQIEQQSKKLYENIANDIKEINEVKNNNNIFDEDLLEDDNVIDQNNQIHKKQEILRDQILTIAKQQHGHMFPVKSEIIGSNIVKSNEELSIDMSRLDRSFAIITQDMYGLKQDMFILRGNVQEAVDKIAKLFDLMAVSMESRQ